MAGRAIAADAAGFGWRCQTKGRIDFKGAERGTWALRAANFRLLVQPTTIANHCRLEYKLGSESGYYWSASAALTSTAAWR